MKQLNQKRIDSTIKFFAFISLILSIGHLTLLLFDIPLERDIDKLDPTYGSKHLSFWSSLPFFISVGVTTIILFYAALMIFACSKNPQATYYYSIIGMTISFAMAVYSVTQALDYNVGTRSVHKHDKALPKLLPMYWTLQADVGATLIFVFPMMTFIFHHSMKRVLKQERGENKIEKFRQGGYLTIFFLQAFAQIGLITNLYQYSAKQDKQDYDFDNTIDFYAFYFAVGTIAQLISAGLLDKDACNAFLGKKNCIRLAVVIGLFQLGTFTVVGVKAVSFSIRIGIIGDDLCKIEDCQADKVFKWELLGYTIFSFLAVLFHINYIIKVSEAKDRLQQARDTLLTSEELQN